MILSKDMLSLKHATSAETAGTARGTVEFSFRIQHVGVEHHTVGSNWNDVLTSLAIRRHCDADCAARADVEVFSVSPLSGILCKAGNENRLISLRVQVRAAIPHYRGEHKIIGFAKSFQPSKYGGRTDRNFHHGRKV